MDGDTVNRLPFESQLSIRSRWRPPVLSLTTGESTRIAHAVRQMLGDEGFPSKVSMQVAMANALAAAFERDVPRVAQTLARLRYEDDYEAVVIRGLPSDENVSPLIALTFSCQLGEPFNYAEQNGGALAMRIAPKDGSAGNTNATRDEFKWHSDDAAMPASLRATWITLSGVRNPPRTLTGYVPIRVVLDDIDPLLWSPLWSPRYLVRVPLSFGLGDNLWTEPRPLLTVDNNEMVAVACPTYATKTADPGDVEAQRAFDHLCGLLDRHGAFVPVSPGTLFAFSNARGLHMRTAIGSGDRLIFRTYIRPDLDALRAKCRHQGHVFSLSQLL